MAATRKSKTRKKAGKKTRAKKTAAKKKAVAKKASRAAKSKSAGKSLESMLFEPLAEIEKALGEIRRRDWFHPAAGEWPDFSSLESKMPSVDVIDRKKEIVIKAEVPGIDEDDLKVSVTDRTLTIKGESRSEEETEEDDVHRREIRRGSIYRTLTLPADVDGSKARATCKNGVLKLRLPKKRGTKTHSVKLS